MHQRVKDILEKNSIEYKLVLHEEIGEIKSAKDFIEWTGIRETQVLKTIIYSNKKTGQIVGAILPALKRTDLNIICDFMEVYELSLANPDELAKVAEGYELNGISPIGVDIPFICELSILEEEYLFVGSGTSGEELMIRTEDLLKFTNPKITKIILD